MAPLNRISLVALAVATIIVGVVHHRQEVAAFDPLVETGTSRVSSEGKHVAVHVPGFFNMVLDTRGHGKGLRMSQSVMSGLVNIFMDREKQPDNSIKGPIRVKVGGLTMYNNGEPDLSSSAEAESEFSQLNNNDQPGRQTSSRLGSLFNRQSSQ